MIRGSVHTCKYALIYMSAVYIYIYIYIYMRRERCDRFCLFSVFSFKSDQYLFHGVDCDVLSVSTHHFIDDRCLSMCICLSVCLSLCLSVYLGLSPCVCGGGYPSVYLFLCLSLCDIYYLMQYRQTHN